MACCSDLLLVYQHCQGLGETSGDFKIMCLAVGCHEIMTEYPRIKHKEETLRCAMCLEDQDDGLL